MTESSLILLGLSICMHPLKIVLKVQKIYIKQKKFHKMILLLLTLVGAFTCGQKEAVVCFSYFEKNKIRGRKKIREKMYLLNNVTLVDTNSLNIHAVLLNLFEIPLLVDIQNQMENFQELK